ncbi:EAL domain-containing protein [Demequina sp. TTPB684]|uniref:EAL domain-containing protein n=1 Tax=unclassified Demequina TaxID=2620311 RepID=UPI001CF564AB|nr:MULTISPECIES: EAL domain-containing protein [unclassified Demequina]MCB2411818.1 EAL domain-containing protein [Demequina sp. TTPB684]UPU88829.1 EAL domain-containing protein [Demequina sp. TMPB413]
MANQAFEEQVAPARVVTMRLSIGLYVVATAAVTLLVALLGGAPNTWVHLYYLPILYVAVRHGARAAAAAGIVAGLAVGPWMPSSVAGETYQALDSWIVRLAFFVLIGVVAAILAKADSRPLDLVLRDFYVARGLRAALRHDQIRVHYQPLIELTEGEVIGFEALCRWYDAKGRVIPPDRFIPEAERTGVINAVGSRVLRQAVNQAQQWSQSGRPDLLVTVNVSAVQLSEPAFLRELVELVDRGASEGFRLCLEITETAIIADPVGALATLRAARERGVTIALDDFGTGQSSLAYLSDFPIDIIKIDKSFVAAVGKDPKTHALVRTMVQMAHSLGALTIAEGIERPEQLKALRALGCAIGQGYYLGRPGDVASVSWATRDMIPATRDSAGSSA